MKNNQPKQLRQSFNQSLLIIVLTLTFATIGSAAPGDLDPTWGNGGIAVASLGIQNTQDIPNFLHTQPDGKIIVSGYENNGSSPGPFVSFIARFNANGTLDTSFGTDGKILSSAGGGEYFYA